jgi:glutaredoxin-like protein NrdH
VAEAAGSVPGARADHSVAFYGLSTCVWCKKTREFLESEGVAFDFTYVDLLTGDERSRAIDEVTKVNPRTNFPTVVVDGEQVVVGYDPDKLKEALGL